MVIVHSTGSGLPHKALMGAYAPSVSMNSTPFHSQKCPALGSALYGHLTWFYFSCPPYGHTSELRPFSAQRYSLFWLWLLTCLSLFPPSWFLPWHLRTWDTPVLVEQAVQLTALIGNHHFLVLCNVWFLICMSRIKENFWSSCLIFPEPAIWSLGNLGC